MLLPKCLPSLNAANENRNWSDVATTNFSHHAESFWEEYYYSSMLAAFTCFWHWPDLSCETQYASY